MKYGSSEALRSQLGFWFSGSTSSCGEKNLYSLKCEEAIMQDVCVECAMHKHVASAGTCNFVMCGPFDIGSCYFINFKCLSEAHGK